MRNLLVIPCLALLPLTAMAEGTPVDAVYACADEADDAARLACYDAAVGRMKTAQDAGEIATVTRADVEEVQKDTFGFSIPSLPRLALPRLGGGSDSSALEELALSVAHVRRDPYGKLVVTLENGQVWHQTDSSHISYSRRRGVEAAVVRRASLGSYRMKLDGGRAFRVRREK